MEHRSSKSRSALALSVLVFVPWGFAYTAEAQTTLGSNKPVEVAEKKSRFSGAWRNATALCDANDAGIFFGGEYGQENLDILARAQKEIRVRAASTLPPPKEELLDRFALEALLQDDDLGALKEADAYSKLISGHSSFYGLECVSSVIKRLEAAGQKREAGFVQGIFPEALQPRSNSFVPKGEPEEQVLQNIRETSILTRHCLAAIGRDDKGTAKSDSEKLLAVYQTDSPPEEWKPPCSIHRQNLFCTLLNVARRLSDRGWYLESNALLEKLKAAAIVKKDWSSGIDLILIEQTINAERTSHKREELWDRLDKAPLFSWQSGSPSKKETHDFSTSEKLRLLGVAFYSAGELSRADTLIARALKTYREVDATTPPEHRIEHSREEGVAGDHVMLMLSAACVKAAEHKFDESNAFIDKALQGPPVATAAYGGRLAELVGIYQENQRTSEAIAFLEKARDKNIPVAFRMARHSTSSPYVVEFWLAKLLFDSGKPAEARPIIEGAIEHAVHPIQRPNSREQIPGIRIDDYDYAPFILAANCAVAVNDYGAAALRYEQAGMARRVGSLPVSEIPVLQQLCLQRAIEFASKASNFHPADKARIYMELATTFKLTSPQQAFDFDKTASDLLPDSDAKKPSLLAEMANLSQQINLQQNANVQSQSSASPSTNGVATSGHTHETENIILLRQAAQTAEKAGVKAVYGRYLTLANAEAQSPDTLNQAVKDCEHAIQLYDGIAAPSFEWWGYGRTAPLNVAAVASRLISNGRTEEGIKLMETATTKVRLVNGLSSRETQEQLQTLMEFYISQKDIARALTSLDQVLECKMEPWNNEAFSSSHSDPGFNMEPEYRWAKSIASESPQSALNILAKVLAAQRKQIPPDDPQIANTYLALANVHSIMKDDQAALSDYQYAFDINKLYFGEQAVAYRMPMEYFTLLRKAGRNTEADRLEVLKQTPFQNRSVPIRRRKTKPQDVDTSVLRAEYEKEKSEAPYSSETQNTLRQLAAAARFKSDWALALECALQILELDTHFEQPLTKIAADQQTLINLYIRAGKVDVARTWLEKLANNKGANQNDLSRFQEQVLREYIRIGRYEDARTQLQVLWGCLYRS